MTPFNWQQKDWPRFSYRLENVEDTLYAFAERVGHVSGLWRALPEGVQTEAVIDQMVAEAIKTSAIEGEYLSRMDVMSSIRMNLGLMPQTTLADKKAEGAGQLMIDVRKTFNDPLTREKLFAWHKMLLGNDSQISVGKWRTHAEPMQIISGAMGKEKVHFEAPPSHVVPGEMDRFITWFNETGPGSKNEIRKAPVRAAVAHLYFESIHPFEDGNGRIGRAIAEKALSQGIGRPAMLSLSRTIEANKKDYYAALETAQRNNEISAWIAYFVKVTLDAQIEAEQQIDYTLQKVKFFDFFRQHLNERQVLVLKRMFAEGPKGFEGGMNARKYVGIAKTSKATATRDLQHLVEIGALIPSGGGRSVSYRVKFNS